MSRLFQVRGPEDRAPVGRVDVILLPLFVLRKGTAVFSAWMPSRPGRWGLGWTWGPICKMIGGATVIVDPLRYRLCMGFVRWEALR